MLKISDQDCYSSAEIVAALGKPFTPKRIEHLRAVGLIPKPIKVGTGDGTIGYYPEHVIKHLHHVEKKHGCGKSYRQLAVDMKDEVAAIDRQTQKIREGYKAEKMMTYQTGHYLRLISKKKNGALVKLNRGDVLIGVIDSSAEKMARLQRGLKSLFARKDNMRMEVLLKIKAIIEEIHRIHISQMALTKVKLNLRRFGQGQGSSHAA